MEKIIEKLGLPLQDFDSIKEYLSQFKNFTVIDEDIERNNGKVKVLCNDEIITILFLEISTGKWWSIYRYHSDGTKYEQIDILIFDEIKDSEYNQVIKYSAHIEDDTYSYITCSGHSYLNGKFNDSWKESRVVPISDLSVIQYSKSMNLTELVSMVDDYSSHIIKKDSVKNVKTLVLKLENNNI